MNRLSSKYIVVLSFVLGNIFPLHAVLAQAQVPTLDINFGELMGKFMGLVNWFFTLLIVLSVAMVLYAAFSLLTSGGDPSRVESGKRTLLWAIVGFSVAILSKGIITLVCNWVIGTCPATFLFFLNLSL